MESGYLYAANNIFQTLLAISEEEQSHGLMYQAWPPPVMSFIYAEQKCNKFWMHKTPSPLDIVFCCDGQITLICKGDPYSTAMIGDDRFSDLVVEFPYGTVSNFGIKLGHAIGLVKPTKEELNKIIATKYHRIIKI